MELILYPIFFIVILCVFGYNEIIIISKQSLVEEYNQAQKYLESNKSTVEDIKVVNKLNNKIQLNKRLTKYSILSKYKNEINQMKLFDLNSTEIE